MTKKEVVSFWLKAATDDFKTAEILFEKKRYLPCLFFCHLRVEKFIKAIIVQKEAKFEPIHNLSRLANLAKLQLPQEIKGQLLEISEFNIRARYDDYKNQLYRKANREFTQKYLIITKGIIKCLKEFL